MIYVYLLRLSNKVTLHWNKTGNRHIMKVMIIILYSEI